MQGKGLQPDRKAYGGLGYAKHSTFLELDDPTFADKFQQLWDEHVPGFSGKVLAVPFSPFLLSSVQGGGSFACEHTTCAMQSARLLHGLVSRIAAAM